MFVARVVVPSCFLTHYCYLVIGCFEPAQLSEARTRADHWDAGRYSTNAGFVPELGRNVLDILAPR